MIGRLVLPSLLLIAMAALIGCGPQPDVAESFVIHNPSDTQRQAVVELDAQGLGISADPIRVVDDSTDTDIPHQLIDADDDSPALLLVLADLQPGESRTYRIEQGSPGAMIEARAGALYVERRDDVAWENDRVAFRTYGEGLWELESLVSSGIDVFTKRTDALVLERWYDSGDYHTDHGEGADFFKVGSTMGGGGTAVLLDGVAYPAPNFRAHRILADGPLRAIVELEYGPWEVDDRSFEERRRITIDAGSDFYRQETWLEGDLDGVEIAAGLVDRPDVATASDSDDAGAVLVMWGPVEDPGYGDLGTAIVANNAQAGETAEHYILHSSIPTDGPFVHYVGSCWTEAGFCDNQTQWQQRVDAFRAELGSPFELR